MVPKARNPNIDKAKDMFDKGAKLIEIASQLNVPEGTVRSWKNRYKWNRNATGNNRNVVSKSVSAEGSREIKMVRELFREIKMLKSMGFIQGIFRRKHLSCLKMRL